MKKNLRNLLRRLAAKFGPRRVSAPAPIDAELESTKRLKFIVANPAQFDSEIVVAARKELRFRADFLKETEVTISLSKHVR